MDTRLQESEFTRQVAALRQRLTQLRQRADEALQQAPELVPQTLEALETALAELDQQTEELALSRQALEAERQRYQDLFQFAPDGYLVTNLDGKILEANQAAAALLGRPAPALVGKPLAVFVLPAAKRDFRRRLLGMAEAQEVQKWEVQLQSETPFDAAVTVATVRDDAGKPLTLRWLVRDITDSNRATVQIQVLNAQREQRLLERTAQLEAADEAREALHESEQRFQRIVSSAPGMVYQFVLHPDGRMEFPYISEGSREIFGLEPHEIQQDPAHILKVIILGGGMTFLDYITQGDLLTARRWEGQYALPSGKQKWCQGFSWPEHHANGDIVCEGLVIDITARKQVEDALRASEERYRLLADNSRDLIAMVDAQGTVLYASPSHLQVLGYTPDALTHQSLARILNPQDAELADTAIQEVLASGQSQTIQLHLLKKDGDTIDVEAILSGIPDAADATPRILLSARDITERSRAEHVTRGLTQALTRLLHALTTSPELETFLGQVLAAIAEALGSHYTSLWFYEREQDALVLHMVYDCGRIVSGEQDEFTLTTQSPKTPFWQEMVRYRRPVVIEDVAGDPRIYNSQRLLDKGAQTLLKLPLLDHEVLGFLSIASPIPRRYQPEEIALAQTLAQQACLAVQMTRLAAQGRHAAVLHERNRLAREIHDTLAQGFTGILLQLEAAEEMLSAGNEQSQDHITRARVLARQSLAEARRSVWALRPQALEHDNLPIALTALARQMTFGTPVQAELCVQGIPYVLPADTENDLLRIGVEALTNALKHAEASAIEITVAYETGRIRLCVQDNGKGFDPWGTTGGSGLGLTGMRERAERMGGRFQVVSQSGQGAEIVVAVPT